MESKNRSAGDYLGYGDSQYRDSLHEEGAVVSADYLDEGGVTVTELNFKNTQPRLDQNAYFLSARKHFHVDALKGKITLRADGHFIDNTDPSNDTDDVSVGATQASFLTYDKKYYADFGYAYSHYQNNLYVNQYTPTVALGLFEGDGWLQLRGYFIETSNPDRAQSLSSTQDAEIKYTHWLTYLQGEYNESVKYYQAALEQNAKSLDAGLGITLPLLAQQRWQEAAMYAKQVLDKSPNQYTAYLRLIVAEEGARDWSAMKKHAEALTEHYPSDISAFVYLARANAWLGDKDAAKKAYAATLSRLPKHYEATAYLAKN